jgi:hypothetical protein
MSGQQRRRSRPHLRLHVHVIHARHLHLAAADAQRRSRDGRSRVADGVAAARKGAGQLVEGPALEGLRNGGHRRLGGAVGHSHQSGALEGGSLWVSGMATGMGCVRGSVPNPLTAGAPGITAAQAGSKAAGEPAAAACTGRSWQPPAPQPCLRLRHHQPQRLRVVLRSVAGQQRLRGHRQQLAARRRGVTRAPNSERGSQAGAGRNLHSRKACLMRLRSSGRSAAPRKAATPGRARAALASTPKIGAQA